jgi:hypothetical protein
VNCSPYSELVARDALDLAGELTPCSPFRCAVLHAILPVRVCLLRQAVSARQRTHDTWRGQGSDFPSCTERCALGAKVRRSVAGADSVTWKGSGQNRRVALASPRHRMEQLVAMRRLAVVGLLEIPPCLDEPPSDESDSVPQASNMP